MRKKVLKTTKTSSLNERFKRAINGLLTYQILRKDK